MDAFLLFVMPPLIGLIVYYIRKENLVQRIIRGFKQIKKDKI